jgi:multicomponent K+:H+ antiporter subunit C
MEYLVASAIAVLTGSGIYLMLRLRTFPVILGLSLLAYAVNFFLFTSGRLMLDAPPLLYVDGPHTDALPQALTLTAIVISFGMTALAIVLAVSAFLKSGSDSVNMDDTAPEVTPSNQEGAQ